MIANLRAPKSASEGAKTKTHQLYLAGAVSIARFKELTTRWRNAFAKLHDECVRRQAAEDAGRIDTLSAEAVVEEALKLQDTWPTLDRERKRQGVQSLVESIAVDAAALGITLRFTCLPSSEETTNTQQRV